MACVRVAQIGSGLSLTTTELMVAFAPRLTLRVAGYAPDPLSQYVPTLPSLAFVSTKSKTWEEAVIGFPAARLVSAAGLAAAGLAPGFAVVAATAGVAVSPSAANRLI